MSKKFKTIITTAGAEKLAAATVPGGKKVNLTAMAVGDGGGTLPEPNAGQTKLINEVWRHALNKISQDNKNKNYIVAELVIPPDVGGFWMRELGLYDDAGTLIAVANMAESYKPKLAEGSGRAQTCRMVIIVSNVDSVALSIDATTVMATQDYVDDKLAEHEQSRKHPDATLKEKGFVQLSNATDSESESHAATPKAVKEAYDLASGKYTAQDASTAQKGIVQLSSATDSNDEGKAATSKAVKAANDNAEKRLAKEQNGRDIPEKDVFVRNIGAARVFSGTVSIGGGGNWTTAEFIVWLESQGAFNHPYWMCKGSWSYGDNRTITDTGCGNIQLAGAVVEVMGVRDAMTIRVTTPTSSTTGVVNAQFTYVNHGGGYPAIWRRDFNTANKPTSEDVGALPITGGALRGPLRFLFQGARPDANCMIANDDASGILSCAYGYYQDRFDIHFYDEKGAWSSNPLTISRDGSTSIHGYLAVFGAIDTTEGIYDKGNRVYSPVNPPPATDLSAYATQQWVLQNFVQNIDLTAPAEVGFRDGWGYPRGTDGAAMYNFNMVGGSSNVGNFIVRYTRKLVNNTWYVIN
ncbi:phage tail protein [Citrobacter werkmanii]|uniref:phage tail protein n=1 Tax=Citrobacter werkmanii TaxID=67827 RepID=UPI001F2BE7A5|nr:phage tail protein [Citrobacter werkmanii]